jgi:K+-transporting ATPase ATPase B chain
MLFTKKILKQSLLSALIKFNPVIQIKNPIMFCVWIGAAYSTILILIQQDTSHFTLQITAWLWLTVFFANFAESIAEGRGKAQAATLKKSKQSTDAKKT